MQTPEGVKRHRQTMIKKFGSYEAWRDWMRANGSKGGAAHNKGGFNDRALARRAGAIGGRVSRPYTVKPNKKRTK